MATNRKLPLTPDILAAAYDYLRVTPPFKRWKLPESDDIEFHVVPLAKDRGDAETIDGHHIIRISHVNIGRTHSLMSTMAHEMIHIYLDRKGVKAAHGKDFHKCADRVCETHGFDRHLF